MKGKSGLQGGENFSSLFSLPNLTKKGSYLYFRDCRCEIIGIILIECEITRENGPLDRLCRI